MGVILAFLGMVLLALFIRLLGVEIGAHHKPLCRWLVRIAAARLHVDERAAAESEWLQVIEDLRSPTAQLLHSVSYVFSALRIRQEFDQQPRTLKIVLGIQAGGMGVITGFVATLVIYHQDELAGIVRQHVMISKPVALVLLVTSILVTVVIAYANHHLIVWYFSRRARRRASKAIE